MRRPGIIRELETREMCTAICFEKKNLIERVRFGDLDSDGGHD